MAFKKSTKKLLKSSQKTIQEIKKTFQNLSQKQLLEPIEKPKKTRPQKKEQVVKVVLSVDSVVKATIAVLGVLVGGYLIFFLKNVILLFLGAMFLAAAFNPTVDHLEQYKIPRSVGIFLLYIVVFTVLIVIFSSLLPLIAQQVSELAINIGTFIRNVLSGEINSTWIPKQLITLWDQVSDNINQVELINNLSSELSVIGGQLTDFAGNAIGAIFSFFNGVFNLLLVLILSFFMVVSKRNTSEFFHSLFPARYSEYISEKANQVTLQIGAWIRGQLLLALATALMTFIIFSIIGIDFALTLSLISGLCEFIPFFGPIITFASAALIAVNQDPVLLIALVPAYAIIQLLEGNILVPLIIGRSVGLNPIVVIISLLAGATIGFELGGSIGLGLVGMIVAVPVVNIISIFIADYTVWNKEK